MFTLNEINRDSSIETVTTFDRFQTAVRTDGNLFAREVVARKRYVYWFSPLIQHISVGSEPAGKIAFVATKNGVFVLIKFIGVTRNALMQLKRRLTAVS